MSDTILDVRNLQVEFKTDTRIVRAVDGISFQVKRGRTLGIVGESGSGKSVTSLAVMGLIPNPPGRITNGEIWFDPDQTDGAAVDLRTVSQEKLRSYRGDRIAMIFQEPMSSLNPVYTCGYQLVEAIRQHTRLSEPEARRRAISLLQEVRVLPPDAELKRRQVEEMHQSRGVVPSEADLDREINRQKSAMLDRYPHELSGGQLQRIMIAMAISCNPTLLIADEPTTALDVTVQATILDLLRELRDRRGMSMMFITHDLGLIAEIADEVAVMYEGSIVEYGSVLDIFSNPQHPYTRGLLTCRPQPTRRLRFLPTVSDFMDVSLLPTGEKLIQAKKQDVNAVLADHQDISEAEFDRRLKGLQQQAPLVSVHNLQVAFPVRGVLGRTKRYLMAVNDVSFEVYPGETLGLVGESGCGKSTLARTLMRLIEPRSGQVMFEGRDILALSSKAVRQLRREIQIIFQNPYSSLDPRMNIGDAVMEPLQIYGRGGKKQHRDRVAYLLERVGLNPNWINRYPHEFSGGQRQRVCIARSLALNPKFIICDESVSALDVSVQAQVLNLLKELQSEFGLTYIFISHDLSVVKFMSDRIIVMNRGKIEEVGTADSIYSHPQQAYTQQLISAIPLGTLDRIRERQLQRGLSA
ncbi:ABC transporter ATP-binding protein [Myxacorys almedinensis]|uniref:Dipeptide ABC transporter ATP-binding protein n=1 Tax=Myxacorys almedinensis A TaxID=2690445 RepID=A0A8J7Z497_9CYAN|nr:ABC transporter ATP-binding protein [Myxacorys almedinensis]NDJ16183.1 dipeptide ABC transporter ATP-binding protein [Myxacorys almedinensis A]